MDSVTLKYSSSYSRSHTHTSSRSGGNTLASSLTSLSHYSHSLCLGILLPLRVECSPNPSPWSPFHSWISIHMCHKDRNLCEFYLLRCHRNYHTDGHSRHSVNIYVINEWSEQIHQSMSSYWTHQEYIRGENTIFRNGFSNKTIAHGSNRTTNAQYRPPLLFH